MRGGLAFGLCVGMLRYAVPRGSRMHSREVGADQSPGVGPIADEREAACGEEEG